MFKKIVGGALAALLVTSATAATAAQPVRPADAKVSGIKSGIRTSSANKGDSAAMGAIGSSVGGFVIGGAALAFFVFGALKSRDWANDDDDSPR